MLTFHIISLFPNALSSYIFESILKRAQERKIVKIKLYDLHDFAESKWNKTDERPYGGGPGMVLLVWPILRAVEKAIGKKKEKGKKKTKIIVLSPGGKTFTNSYGATLAKKYTDIVLICGRYEGIDARVKKILKAEELSVGDYVLTGGELPALVVMDTISRQIPGVLGKFASLEENRVSSHEVYTRPEVFEWKKKRYQVPKVLLTGNHKKIALWKQSRKKTKGSSENNSPISPPNFPNLRLFFRQKSFTAAAAAPQDFFSQKKSNLGKI